MAQINEHGIQPIDLVVVNLYPFKETISKEDVTYEEAIENIDIGGPGMLRAASKEPSGCHGYRRSGRLQPSAKSNQRRRQRISSEKRELAAKVFRHTAAYDALIADYLTNVVGEKEPEQFTVTFEKNNRFAMEKTRIRKQLSIKQLFLSKAPLRKQNSFTEKSFLTTTLKTRMLQFKSFVNSLNRLLLL